MTKLTLLAVRDTVDGDSSDANADDNTPEDNTPESGGLELPRDESLEGWNLSQRNLATNILGISCI